MELVAPARQWDAFSILPFGIKPQPTRSIATLEGVGDRLRAAAFAEIQARDAFAWAADRYQDAPPGLRDTWLTLAGDEDRHLRWLLSRLTELGYGSADRAVSDRLWRSLVACPTAKEFAFFMAEAEARGREAGLRFNASMRKLDPASADIFGQIASEEAAHIAVARRFF